MTYTIDRYSERGNQDINQDYVFADTIYEGYLLSVIADGMGELDHAAEASRLVVEKIKDSITKGILCKGVSMEELVFNAIEEANERIFQERQRLFCKMGAAVAVVLYHNNQAYISWLGDVRVYLVRNSHMHLLTTDHTIENLKDITVLNPKKYIHILTRCVKGTDIEEIPIIKKEVLSGDRFVLCSDGFYNAMDEKKIPVFPVKKLIGDIIDPEDDFSVIEISF